MLNTMNTSQPESSSSHSEPPFREHPLRAALNDEMHARPFIEVDGPQRIVHLVLWFPKTSGQRSDRDQGDAVLQSLCAALSLPAAPTGSRHWVVALPAKDTDQSAGSNRRTCGQLKWERHGEFATLLLQIPDAAADAPIDAPSAFAMDLHQVLPAQWLQTLPVDVIAATLVRVVQQHDAYDQADWRARAYGPHPVLGVQVGGGQARVYTDFRIGDTGLCRYLLVNQDSNPRLLGREAQRLCELEAYRMMAMLGFPVAQTTGRALDQIEQRLAVLSEQLARAPRDADGALLAEVSDEALELERLATTTAFRFGASRAYHALVKRRLQDLREQRISGLQTLSGFLDRRLGPAMATCESVDRRLHDLAARVHQANELLRARVDIEREQQNQMLLNEMNRRGELQLRLQHTVEGLSIAAITYYAAGLIGYGAKAAKTMGWTLAGLPINPDLVTGLAILPVGVMVAWFTHQLRNKLTRDLPGGQHAAGAKLNS